MKTNPLKPQFWASLLFILLLGLQLTNAQAMEQSIVANPNDMDLKWIPCIPPFEPGDCEISILHGDPAKPNTDVFYKIPPDTAFKKHWHASAERMILLTGELEITYEGEQKETITAGSYLYGPAKKPHVGKCVSEKPCTLFIAFELPVNTVLN